MGSDRGAAPNSGWFRDPTGRAELRFWTGQKWTSWVWDGTAVASDPHPLRKSLNGSDLDHLTFIDRVFLPEARAMGVVTPQADAGLGALLRQLKDEASGVWRPDSVTTSRAPAPVREPAPSPAPDPTPSPPVMPVGATPVMPVGPAPALPVPPSAVMPVPPSQAVPYPPYPPWPAQAHGPAPEPARRSSDSAFARWWERSRQAIGSDLAVHGLAYLGVLMFFVGVFGLVVFAFGDVTPVLRPLAEFLIAIAPFAAGAMLLRRQALIVGRALEVMGGLLLPIMVATTLVDGVAFPPDPHGIPLVLVLTALTGLIAACYAWWSMRHLNSALRYLVAPMTWLTVAMATLGVGRAIPVGKGVATPTAVQVAAIAAALVVTLALARSRPQSVLAGPTLVIAGPSLLVVALLALLTWAAEGWPTGSVLISGLLILTALELLRERLPVTVLGLAEPCWWATVWWAAVESGVGSAPAALAAALVFVIVTEVAAAARRPVWAVVLPAVGAAAALACTWPDPRWATAALALAAVWALGRRMVPFQLPDAATALDLAAAVLPLLALVALAEATSRPAALAAGTGVVLLSTVPAARPVLRRDPEDTFWIVWWRAVATLMALSAMAVSAEDLGTTQHWLVTGSLVLIGLVSLVGPIPGVWRAWPVTTIFTAAWFTACATLDAPDLVRAGALAVAGLAMVVAAHLIGRVAGAVTAGADSAVGLAGHVLGLLAVMSAAEGRWSLVVAVGLATAGWIVTAVRDGLAASPVGDALRRIGGWLVWLPVGFAALGAPLTVALALDAGGVLRFGEPWAFLVPAVTALAYAAATWLRLPDRFGATAEWAGFVAALVGSAVAWERLPQCVALGALVVSIVVLRPQRRAPVMTWTAWLVCAPLAGLLAAQVWPWFGRLPWQTTVVMTWVTVGGVLLVGGAAADLHGRAWAPRSSPAHSSSLGPVVIGAAELIAGVALAYLLLTRQQAGWVSVIAAGAVLATAALAGAGALSGVAALVGWGAVVLLAGGQIDVRPWIPVVVALGLLAAAHLISSFTVKADARPLWWARWDVPLLVTAAPVALTALFAEGGSRQWGATFVAVGLESLLVAVRLRRVPAVATAAAAIGTGLVLAGAANAGDGWLALALLGFSAALTALALSAEGRVRLLCQISGALAALVAWQVTTFWLSWPLQQSIDVTAVGAGVLAMAAALVARFRLLERSWSLVWGGMAVAVAAFVAGSTASLLGWHPPDAQPGWPVAAGLLLVAVALLTGAEPLAETWLSGLGMVCVAVSVTEALQAGQAGAGVQVMVLAGLSAVCAVLSLSLFVRGLAQKWRTQVLFLGVALDVGAIAVAVSSPSTDTRMYLAAGLAASALQAAAVGVVVRTIVAQILSPILACASWLAFSSSAQADNLQGAMPIGLATLTVVELWRRDRRQQAGPVASTDIVVLELTGVAFLIGPSFVQAVTDSVLYAVLATALGLVVLGWGLVTKVRRRVATGGLTVLASCVVLVAVPLVGLLPSWQGAGLWLLIAAVGLGALLVASFLEQGKAAARKGVSRFGEATAGWE